MWEDVYRFYENTASFLQETWAASEFGTHGETGREPLTVDDCSVCKFHWKSHDEFKIEKNQWDSTWDLRNKYKDICLGLRRWLSGQARGPHLEALGPYKKLHIDTHTCNLSTGRLIDRWILGAHWPTSLAKTATLHPPLASACMHRAHIPTYLHSCITHRDRIICFSLM